MKSFLGRETYLDKLNTLWRKSSSSFVVVAERKRIGKSTLVEEFAALSKCDFIELVGLASDQCLGFWGRKADRTSTGDILGILAVTSGIPKDLDEIDPSLSSDENIRRLCYDPDGYRVDRKECGIGCTLFQERTKDRAWRQDRLSRTVAQMYLRDRNQA